MTSGKKLPSSPRYCESSRAREVEEKKDVRRREKKDLSGTKEKVGEVEAGGQEIGLKSPTAITHD
jgi:hypothetical protein